RRRFFRLRSTSSGSSRKNSFANQRHPNLSDACRDEGRRDRGTPGKRRALTPLQDSTPLRHEATKRTKVTKDKLCGCCGLGSRSTRPPERRIHDTKKC